MENFIFYAMPVIESINMREIGRKNRATEVQSSEVLCRKGVLRNFTKVTGKHLCHSLFFNKVAGLRPATLLKKKLWHRF